MKLFAGLLASHVALVAGVGCELKVVDFSELTPGQKVGYSGFKALGYNFDVRVIGNGNCSPGGQPTIFDTDNPTCGDDDLSAGLGNALIIQEDSWISNCVPNDCRRGGRIVFEFEKSVLLKKLVLADNDERSGTEVWFTKANGETINLPTIPAGNDGDIYTLLFNEDAKNVVELNVAFTGSGGIPELVYQECSGGGFGDPHFRTHSGEKFDYHGECDLVLTKAPHFDNGKGLDLHVRTTQQDWYSHISGAALRIGTDVLEVEHELLRVNGQETKFDDLAPPLSFAGYSVTYDDTPVIVQETERKRKMLTVHTTKEEAIEFTIFGSFMRVNTINAKKANFAGASGITGHFSSGLMLSRDENRIIADPDEFGQEWQVNGDDPKLFHEVRSPQWPAKCVVAPPMDERRKLRGITKEQANEACSVLEDDIDDCVFDVLSTGDLTVVGAHLS